MSMRVIVLGLIAAFLLMLALPTLTTVALINVFTQHVNAVGNELAKISGDGSILEIYNPRGELDVRILRTSEWPTSGITTSEYGELDSTRADLGLGIHQGLDIANTAGTPIDSVMDGLVSEVNLNNSSSCGIYVFIRHTRQLSSKYCHLQATSGISEGDTVSAGQRIGYMGSTGISTGTHLHLGLEIYGVAVDPRLLLIGEPGKAGS